MAFLERTPPTRMSPGFPLGRSQPSEARWIINSLLLEAYEIATLIHPHAAQPLNIQAERGWKYGPVKWHRKKYFLTGRPDYGVWYGEEEAVSLNVVVVEAKREPGGTEQALGYMGKYLSNTPGHLPLYNTS